MRLRVTELRLPCGNLFLENINKSIAFHMLKNLVPCSRSFFKNQIYLNLYQVAIAMECYFARSSRLFDNLYLGTNSFFKGLYV